MCVVFHGDVYMYVCVFHYGIWIIIPLCDRHKVPLHKLRLHFAECSGGEGVRAAVPGLPALSRAVSTGHDLHRP